MSQERSLKEAGDVRRQFFSENISRLIEGVLRLNRLDAAAVLGVDYGWLRKASSVGLSRADSRNISLLTKVADKFHIEVNDLWTPQLLVRIWAGGYLPEVRDYLVKEFNFDQYVAKSRDFRDQIEDYELLGLLPRSEPVSTPNAASQPEPQVSPDQLACEQLKSLLETGRYDYLRPLLNNLAIAEGIAGAPEPDDRLG